MTSFSVSRPHLISATSDLHEILDELRSSQDRAHSRFMHTSSMHHEAFDRNYKRVANFWYLVSEANSLLNCFEKALSREKISIHAEVFLRLDRFLISLESRLDRDEFLSINPARSRLIHFETFDDLIIDVGNRDGSEWTADAVILH